MSAVRSILCWTAGATVVITRSPDLHNMSYLLNDVRLFFILKNVTKKFVENRFCGFGLTNW